MIPFPPCKKKKINPVLFEKIHRIHELAKRSKVKTGVLGHLTNLFEAYQYVYYVWMVQQYLKPTQMLIVDWGGFCGQVTVLLNALGYKVENNVLEYPSTKKDFEEFNISYKKSLSPDILPYENNSITAVISSGVLEHVHEGGVPETKAVAEIYRILEPGGFFFCWNLPRKYALLELLAIIHGTSCHERRYTKEEIMNTLKKQGFIIRDVGTNSGILNIRGVRNIFSLFDPWSYFVCDFYISKIPPFLLLNHHFTIVCQKPK